MKISSDQLWLLFGFFFQSFFALRFVIQWIASEKNKASIIPLSFWYLSLIGSIGVLIYSIKIKDPVFIVGQLFGSIVYIRNLILINKKNIPRNNS